MLVVLGGNTVDELPDADCFALIADCFALIAASVPEIKVREYAQCNNEITA